MRHLSRSGKMVGARPILDYFFAPKSVALFGVSSAPRGLGQQVLRSLVEGGYQGEIYPIHPELRRALALPCFASLDEVPTDVDLVVFATSPDAILPQLEACSRKHVKAVVIISGGFKEKTAQGGELQDRIVDESRARGMRIIGPNCLGIYDPKTKVQTLFQSYERLLRPGPGKIALLTQSTALGTALLEWLAEEGLGVSHFIGYGNRADLDEADFLDYLKDDVETKLIGIHVESFQNGRRFLQAASTVVNRKPIIILKTGRSRRAAENVASHIGALSGTYTLQSAIFRQTGLIEAETVEDLFDALKIFTFYDRTDGPRLATVTNGAGYSIVVTDLAEGHGFQLAEYAPSTRQALKQTLPPHCSIGNPLDLMGSATSDDYRHAINVLLRDERVDILIVGLVLQNTFLDDRITEIMPDLLRLRKPIIACAAGGPFSRQRIAALQMKGIPVYPTPERAVKAAGYLVRRSQLPGRSLDELQPSE